MRIFILTALLATAQSWACRNFIAQSEVPKALAKQLGAGAKACGPLDPCICFDGVDWDTAKYDAATKKIEEDSAKKAAKAAQVAQSAAIKQGKKQSLQDAVSRLKTVSPSTATGEQMKQFYEDLQLVVLSLREE